MESARSILMVHVHRVDFPETTVNSVSLPASTLPPSPYPAERANHLSSIWQVWPQLPQALHYTVDQAGICQGTVPHVPPEYVLNPPRLDLANALSDESLSLVGHADPCPQDSR